MSTTSNPAWERLPALSEDDLRQNVLLPILRRIPNVGQITDVHGVNERGLDIIFASKDSVRTNWYGRRCAGFNGETAADPWWRRSPRSRQR